MTILFSACTCLASSKCTVHSFLENMLRDLDISTLTTWYFCVNTVGWVYVRNLCLCLCSCGRVPASLSGMTTSEFGRITFVFETICSADCELYFMMVRVVLYLHCACFCLWIKLLFSVLTVWFFLSVTPPAGCEQEEHHSGGVLGRQ